MVDDASVSNDDPLGGWPASGADHVDSVGQHAGLEANSGVLVVLAI